MQKKSSKIPRISSATSTNEDDVMAKNYLAISDSTAPSESAFTVAKLKTYQIKDAWPSRLRYFSIRTPSFYRLTACKVNYPLQVYAET